jgi:toxin FitB
VFVLDTNVVSELMKAEIEPVVLKWFKSIPFSQVYITSVSAAELFCGVHLLTDGKRKRDLASLVGVMVHAEFNGRVLNFDLAAAEAFGVIGAGHRKAGRDPEIPDVQIAAIAIARGYGVATRNTRDFATAGLSLVNPWTD